MGVLNTTPDSFSDGGRYFDRTDARARVDTLIREGADIIDIGGESTRPGSSAIPTDEQLRRTRDAVQYAVERRCVVSIDTTNADVAREATSWGASIINDVSCLRDSDALARVAAERGAALVLMHAREPMSAMRGFSRCAQDAYEDVVSDVAREWSAAATRAQAAGVAREDLVLDPGLGFNKNARHSSDLIARLGELVALGWPVLVGPSRKSFLASEIKSEPQRRLGGTAAASIACALRGAAILRVHDVLDVKQALAVARAVGLTGKARGQNEVRDV
jgi:dihydropteroate synthase